MTQMAGLILGIVAVSGLLALIHALPAGWFDDRALMRPMELPDDEMRAALREVDAIAPAAPPVSAEGRLKALVPPSAPSAEVYPHGRRANGRRYQIQHRPPPPPPLPTPAPGPGTMGRR
jgi:hypothetical protein